ncbi:MAG: hypothetical protein M3Q49_02865 [Actinomycetota bacterium]|nr:hypothetical protein [Actinomycetota bacterium]
MRDELHRKFERIVGASHALPGAGLYLPWVAGPLLLALDCAPAVGAMSASGCPGGQEDDEDDGVGWL